MHSLMYNNMLVTKRHGISSCNTTTSFTFLISELMDLLLTGEDQSQAKQLTILAEGPPL